jgi:tRNA (guanine-N(7)-)-methyltransferase
MGDNLKFMLDNNPESIFIGCEPYLNGIANLISKLHENDYDRIKIFDKDVRFLLDLVPNNFFSKIVVLFPDPWKKRRHKKRRIFNANNISLFLNKLEKNGEIYFSTDIEDYFLEVKNFFSARSKMFSIKNKKNFYKKPTFLYLTKYAIKSLEKGVSPKYLVIKKKVDIL